MGSMIDKTLVAMIGLPHARKVLGAEQLRKMKKHISSVKLNKVATKKIALSPALFQRAARKASKKIMDFSGDFKDLKKLVNQRNKFSLNSAALKSFSGDNWDPFMAKDHIGHIAGGLKGSSSGLGQEIASTSINYLPNIKKRLKRDLISSHKAMLGLDYRSLMPNKIEPLVLNNVGPSKKAGARSFFSLEGINRLLGRA